MKDRRLGIFLNSADFRERAFAMNTVLPPGLSIQYQAVERSALDGFDLGDNDEMVRNLEGPPRAVATARRPNMGQGPFSPNRSSASTGDEPEET
jgi:hypothetical protein